MDNYSSLVIPYYITQQEKKHTIVICNNMGGFQKTCYAVQNNPETKEYMSCAFHIIQFQEWKNPSVKEMVVSGGTGQVLMRKKQEGNFWIALYILIAVYFTVPYTVKDSQTVHFMYEHFTAYKLYHSL